MPSLAEARALQAIPQPRACRPVTTPTSGDALTDVLLVSADGALRGTWAATLLGLGLTVTVSQATSIPAARTALTRSRAPDLVLLDAELVAAPGPGPGARPQAVSLLGDRTAIRLIVVGPSTSPDDVRGALGGGARGYLFDDFPVPTPTSAEHHADARAVANRTLTVTSTTGAPRELSRREVEILQLTADGMGNIEIAAVLGLSPLTIKSHLGRIGRKLGSGDRAHLVYLALRAGAVV